MFHELDQIFSARTLQLALIQLIALILSICVHEFGHAFVADRLGDPLPRSQGRVTLNPIAHVDPWGTLVFPLVSFFLTAAGSSLGGKILGWGKPVQISLHARWIRRGMRLKTAHALIALAGPMMNVVFAAVLSIAFLVLVRAGFAQFAGYILMVVTMNIGLALFNLIPCPPLDGGAVLAWFVRDGNRVLNFLNRFGPFLLLFLLFTELLSVIMIPAYLVSDFWAGALLRWAP